MSIFKPKRSGKSADYTSIRLVSNDLCASDDHEEPSPQNIIETNDDAKTEGTTTRSLHPHRASNSTTTDYHDIMNANGEDCKDLDPLEVIDFCSFQTKSELYPQCKKYEALVQKHIKRLLEDTQPDKALLPQILELDACITKNQQSLRQNPLTSSAAWQSKVDWYPQKQLYPLMSEISKLYRDTRPHLSYQPSTRLQVSSGPELHRINSKFDRNWSPPNINRIASTMFDRECTKYWVKSENILKVIAAIIPNLPIYVHPSTKDQTSVTPQISSVYLDDDDFKCYHERINKEEDARVVRCRWYGEEKEIIFIERKLHHKGDAQSIKERFRMKEENIVEFMSGRNDHFDAKINKGNAMKALHREVSEMIQIFELKPTTRIVYNRMSFQLDHTNAVRISLDTDLRFISEKPWLLDRYQWYTKETDIGTREVEWFPFNVLELKLCGKYIDTPPQWIQDLMESDLLMDCYKFSKYGQSIYSFHADEIYITPKWIEMCPQYFDEDKKEILQLGGYEEEETKEEAMEPQVSSTKCLCCRNKEQPPSKKGKKKKVMNPKVYFSNERTFLQWFQAAVFVGSAGLTIRSMNPDDIAAILLIGTSFLILVWAVVVYYRRNYHLLRNEQEGLHDLYGPAVLVCVMIFVMGWSITSDTNVFGAS